MNARLKHERQARRHEYQGEYDEQWMLPSGESRLLSHRRFAENATGGSVGRDHAEYDSEPYFNSDVSFMDSSVCK
jgi:hypothetical protein